MKKIADKFVENFCKLYKPLSAADERLIRNAVDNPNQTFFYTARLYLRKAMAAHDYWHMAAIHLLRCKIVDRDCSVCERIEGEILAYEYPDSEPIDYTAYGFPVRGPERRSERAERGLRFAATPATQWKEERRSLEDRRRKEPKP